MPLRSLVQRNFIVISNQMSHAILTKAARLQVLGKSPASLYLRLNKRIWERLPSRVRDSYSLHSYGAWLHTLVCLTARRQQHFGTFLMRNRPALGLVSGLVCLRDHCSILGIVVLGCIF